jgi:hypothetical protein
MDCPRVCRIEKYIFLILLTVDINMWYISFYKLYFLKIQEVQPDEWFAPHSGNLGQARPVPTSTSII